MPGRGRFFYTSLKEGIPSELGSAPGARKRKMRGGRISRSEKSISISNSFSVKNRKKIVRFREK